MGLAFDRIDGRDVLLVSFEMGGNPDDPKSLRHLLSALEVNSVVRTDMRNCRYEITVDDLDYFHRLLRHSASWCDSGLRWAVKRYMNCCADMYDIFNETIRGGAYWPWEYCHWLYQFYQNEARVDAMSAN